MYLSGRGSHHKGILEMLLGGGGRGATAYLTYGVGNTMTSVGI